MKWKVTLFNPPRGIDKGLVKIFLLEVRIRLQDLLDGTTGCHKTYNRPCRDAHSTNARFPTHDIRIKRNPV
jgi:hypothetical protein